MTDKESKKTDKTPLSVMLGSGVIFEAQGKKYTVLPIKLKELLDFKDGKIAIGNNAQGYNILIDENRNKIDKWLQSKLIDSNGEPMSFEKAVNDDWDTDDLERFLRTLFKISG